MGNLDLRFLGQNGCDYAVLVTLATLGGHKDTYGNHPLCVVSPKVAKASSGQGPNCQHYIFFVTYDLTQ